MLKSSLTAVFFLIFVKNIADFGTPIIVGGNFKMLATEAYKGVISYGEIEKAAAISFSYISSYSFYFSYIQASADCNQCHGKFFRKSGHTEEKTYSFHFI